MRGIRVGDCLLLVPDGQWPIGSSPSNGPVRPDPTQQSPQIRDEDILFVFNLSSKASLVMWMLGSRSEWGVPAGGELGQRPDLA